MTATEAPEPLLQTEPAKATPRPSRPNLGKLHAKTFPLEVYPLPPLIPHNPLSLLHIAFTYIYQLLVSPSSHPKARYQAYFSSETRSVHVTDETAIRTLWECGFFGKGSLSRSEPTWLDREKRRRGLLANETSEEVTRQRREDRKKFKNERARKEREAIEEKLKEEERSKQGSGTATPTARARYEGVNGAPVESLAESIECLIVQEPGEPPNQRTFVKPEPSGTSEEGMQSFAPEQIPNSSAVAIKREIGTETSPIENQEHLQLTPSEAFFLAYGLGILDIHSQNTFQAFSTLSLFTVFRQHSYFPPKDVSSLRPDDPFLLQYIAYHHFRSLGWVVRPGIKFAVDWLLYLRGPVFSHAEFAVIVLPAYRHPYWRSNEQLRRETEKRERKTWWWLHCVNRVQSQVRKSLVIAYVEVPPPSALPAPSIDDDGFGAIDIGRFLKQYRVRELTVKRWIPNRERD